MAEAEQAESFDYQLAIMKYLSVIAHSLLEEEDDWLEGESLPVEDG